MFQKTQRTYASVLVFVLALPLAVLPLARPAHAQNPIERFKRLSMGKKVAIVAGVALLYFLYRRHQKKAAAAGTASNGKMPQLYKSRNGGIYYRDPKNNNKPVWLTVPQQGMQVSQSELRQYAPDYNKYNGQPAPSAPQGYGTQPFTEFDQQSGVGAPGPR